MRDNFRLAENIDEMRQVGRLDRSPGQAFRQPVSQMVGQVVPGRYPRFSVDGRRGWFCPVHSQM
jgi:hypothetical protein